MTAPLGHEIFVGGGPWPMLGLGKVRAVMPNNGDLTNSLWLSDPEEDYELTVAIPQVDAFPEKAPNSTHYRRSRLRGSSSSGEWVDVIQTPTYNQVLDELFRTEQRAD
jgi:hypothetical protein